jgi:hypothetical protein
MAKFKKGHLVPQPSGNSGQVSGIREGGPEGVVPGPTMYHKQV